MSVEAIQITTTVADRADAERIAASLVAKQLAACVQVSGPIESTFRWKGQVQTSQEWAMHDQDPSGLVSDGGESDPRAAFV